MTRLKTIIYRDDGTMRVNRLFVIRKDGLTTEGLIRNIKNLQFDLTTLLSHSISFPNIVNDFSAKFDPLVKQNLDATLEEYTIQAETELSTIISKVNSNSDATLQVTIINVKNHINDAFINDISSQL